MDEITEIDLRIEDVKIARKRAEGAVMEKWMRKGHSCTGGIVGKNIQEVCAPFDNQIAILRKKRATLLSGSPTIEGSKCTLTVKTPTHYVYDIPDQESKVVRFDSSKRRGAVTLALLVDNGGRWVSYKEIREVLPKARGHCRNENARAYSAIADLRDTKFKVKKRYSPFEIRDKQVRLVCRVEND